MKVTALAATLALVAGTAHAESFFQIETAFGGAYGQTLTDGVWYQQGAPDNVLNVKTPAYTLGVTGKLWESAPVDVRWHADYVYIGTESAACSCVADEDYSVSRHAVINPDSQHYRFSGGGHTQGILASLDVGYTWHGWRFGVEAGPWVFWQTWGVGRTDPEAGWIDLSHKTSAQVSWVAGANISRGPWALSYRYYNIPQLWNPYPGLIRAAHVATLSYKW